MSTSRNLVASVHQRLINIARSEGRDPNHVRLHYAMERVLFRLMNSHYADNFILKGGLLLYALGTQVTRPTMDIDLLGWHVKNNALEIESIFRELVSVTVPDDGITISAETVASSPITKGASYEGIRIQFIAKLGTTPIPIKIDIGFGDILYPSPQKATFPSMLKEIQAPRVVCYSKESLIAEKFEAMVNLGRLNTRMKDFYDIWLLSQEYSFAGDRLTTAIVKTFAHRDTSLEEGKDIFTEEFALFKQADWNAFIRRIGINGLHGFPEIISTLTVFLLPVVLKEVNHSTWSPKSGWRIDE